MYGKMFSKTFHVLDKWKDRLSFELYMRGCFERNGSAQNGSKRCCQREAYPYLRGAVPRRAVPKSCVNAAFVCLALPHPYCVAHKLSNGGGRASIAVGFPG